MARFYADRVAFSTASTGTGNITPGSALNDSFLAPSQTSIANGSNPYLLIQEGLDFEICDATYVSAGPHFTRDTVLVSKIGGTVGTTKMNLGGTAVVRFVTPAEAFTLLHSPVTLAGSLTYLTLSGQQITRGAINLATDVTGTLPVASGGTGQTTDAEALGEMIQALTEDTAPDLFNDFLATWDETADTGKKVELWQLSGGKIRLASGTVSAAATLDIVLTGYTAYRAIEFVLSDFLPASDGVDLWARFSTNGGSSYDATGYNFAGIEQRDAAASPTTNASGSNTQIELAGAVGNAATEGCVAIVTLLNQTSAARWTKLLYSSYGIDSTATPQARFKGGGGSREAAQDTDAIRFMFESGNISSGSYAVYGIL